ncbi:hypothetical protein PENSOL_c027G09626 [Penicillium solitum]|uniref:Uncharacterized protein n=1 Tax=Penicillium solitum TaxID=60172 RepID=A0A1V6QYN6_9EURO|nr:uncharacterized protein PENSOL_c027G09626 [Penicillium solitum]OQD94294.1 hypothetical protein PENSOL_c027G09626 [Penicillium solitum]
MASNSVASGPSGNFRSGDKQSEDESRHVTPPETLATAAVAAAASATTPAHEPPTIETEGPSVETIEDIADHTRENTREAIQPTHPQASAPGNEEGSNSQRTRHHRDCIVSRTVHRYPPYLAEVPNALLGQIWIDHIDFMLGVRTERQTEDMQSCIEHTARVLELANDMLRQQREVLADLRRINSEEHYLNSSSDLTDFDDLTNFTDLLVMSDDDDNDGDSSPNGCGTVDD